MRNKPGGTNKTHVGGKKHKENSRLEQIGPFSYFSFQGHAFFAIHSNFRYLLTAKRYIQGAKLDP